ncbi:unnamed protein product [Phytomonas sp. EM1]|nr:unnamed protein product [Phytomonas sp. EM1]|eukprot:CCW61790.1 unnamed protein product [Phytomonas sp. isolate EM1]
MRRLVHNFSRPLGLLATSQAFKTTSPTVDADLKAVNFEDTSAYKQKSTWKLLKYFFILKLCSYERLTQNSIQYMRFFEKILGSKITYDFFVRKTIYDCFCAGANDYELKKTIRALDKARIGVVLDYAVEADCEGFTPAPGIAEAPDLSMSSLVNKSNIQYLMNENAFDENMKLYMVSIMHASLHCPAGNHGLAAIKVTGICDPQLLARVSAILMSIHQSWYTCFTKEKAPKLEECRVVMGVGREHQLYITYDQLREGFKVLGDGVPLSEEEFDQVITLLDPHKKEKIDYFWYKEVLTEATTTPEPDAAQSILIKRLPHMSAVEKKLWRILVKRLDHIVSTAQALGVRALVDAEQTFYQIAIDALVVYLQKRYNKDIPVVYNTYQCYLTYAEDRVANDLIRAKRLGFQWGGKVVRGAYMLQEVATAKQYGYASPIWPTYEQTNKCYGRVAKRIVEGFLANPDMKYEVFFGTHNRESLEEITDLVLKNPILVKHVSFGQLFGMRDNLTIPLAKANFKVYKYLPYGPVKDSVHYLIRRAIENSSVLSNPNNQEGKMIKKEIRRRFLLP